MKKSYLIISIFFVLLLFNACSKDEPIDEPFVCTEEVSYSMDISPIFKRNCALSGCHVSGFGFGNFNEYQDIKNRIGFIINNVFVFMSMPPENTTGPESLTEEELDLLDCWISNGAPDN